MFKFNTLHIAVVAMLLLTTISCGKPTEVLNSSALTSSEVLATVNGTPITQADVLYRISGKQKWREEPQTEPDPAKIDKALEGIILEELTYQKSILLGLDANKTYQELLLEMETQISAFKRKKLSELFYHHEVKRKAEVSDTEALAYATENAAILQTEFHVMQMLRRNEADIQQASTDLQQGQSFDEVAAKRFPDLPESLGKPWDLGFLNWQQVPDVWWETLAAMEPDEVSGIIRGPKRRFWIIKLVDKRKYADYSFESNKQKIVEILEQEKIKQLRASTIKRLKDSATIIYANPSA
jgi:hypothetical protein